MHIGLDSSLPALKAARQWSNDASRWIVADARRIPLADASVDVVVSSLLLHHLDAEDVIELLREAARVCRVGVVIHDLTRSWYSLVLTWVATRLLSRSRVFHVDGPRSVRAAWTPSEFREMARKAGLSGAVVHTQCPFRMNLVLRKAR